MNLLLTDCNNNLRKAQKMGMGMSPCHAWTIKIEDVAKLCPKEFAEFDSAINGEWDAFALAIQVDDTEFYSSNAMAKWEALQNAFKQVTETCDDATGGVVALELSIDYYDHDNGDRYDDLETGCFFMVEGVTRLSTAGERFQEYLTESSWTTWG